MIFTYREAHSRLQTDLENCKAELNGWMLYFITRPLLINSTVTTIFICRFNNTCCFMYFYFYSSLSFCRKCNAKYKLSLVALRYCVSVIDLMVLISVSFPLGLHLMHLTLIHPISFIILSFEDF